MSSKQKVEPPVSDVATDLRTISRHAPKLMARMLGIPVGTAHEWLYRRLPESRQEDVRAVLLAECNRVEALIAETRRRWEPGVTHDAYGETQQQANAAPGPVPAVARREVRRNGALAR